MKLLDIKKWITITTVSLLGLGLQACGPKSPLGIGSVGSLFSVAQPESQEDCGFVQNVYGQRISWKGSVPIQLYLHQSFPVALQPALDRAIQVWESQLGRKLFNLNKSYMIQGAADPKQDGLNVVYWMPSWEADKKAEQARTSVYWLGNQIQEADIRINDAYFNFYLDTPASNQDVHLESLFVHELGHVLGLKHKDADGSVMATYLTSITVRSNIPASDIQNVRCEY